ncbi:hypothetical protein DPMN_040881 [Dreissena polymorpha]|uniref:Uncharacterized protein n=1 Tax=Dreissena polymorpha TaxID=45954 RepID=A0A9D4HXC7_DREPO|nr:hypothetical protein DPMN_040881 [Dreissena polymorpha]
MLKFRRTSGVKTEQIIADGNQNSNPDLVNNNNNSQTGVSGSNDHGTDRKISHLDNRNDHGDNKNAKFGFNTNRTPGDMSMSQKVTTFVDCCIDKLLCLFYYSNLTIPQQGLEDIGVTVWISLFAEKCFNLGGVNYFHISQGMKVKLKMSSP